MTETITGTCHLPVQIARLELCAFERTIIHLYLVVINLIEPNFFIQNHLSNSFSDLEGLRRYMILHLFHIQDQLNDMKRIRF